jgi:membrane-bound lytic murein transglycosylase D
MMPEPRFDPVEDVILAAQAAFERGEKNYHTGHLEMAKQEFNDAIAAILLAPPSLREDKRLQKAFDALVDRIHAYELEALKQGDGFAESTYQPAPLDELQSLTLPEDLPLSEQIQEEAAQTVSDIPLVINGQVGNLIKYFTSGRGRSSLEAGMQAAGRFREMILRVLKEEQVPLDLFYLAQAESAFRPRARSRAGALGIWQFMPSRGKEYGLTRSWWADERMNPEKATRAAARHLKDLYGMFGDWYLAMAAYNCGPLCVSRAVERTGYADFWQLSSRRALPAETRNYIPIVVALTFIGKNAERYGLDQVASEDPWVYDTVTVSHPVDLRLVAEIVGTNVETIRELNPSLLRMTTPNVAGYPVRIPLGTREVFDRRIAMIPPDKWVWWRWHTVHYGETLTGIARTYKTSVKAIAEVNNVNPEAPLQEAAELVIPVVRPGAATEVVASGEELRYRVRANDTLSAIARRFRVSVDQIIAWNKLNGTVIRQGTTLVIFGMEDSPSAPSASSSPSSEARRTLASTSPNGAADRQPLTAAARTAELVHRVRRGESLWQIAANYNIPLDTLRRLNTHLGRTLRVGDRVMIPATR